ncbi:hypothetical protein L1987_64058 [Smallanthus sonchifolius]|uniref:Uncharacterized protein n=1 Tax=Smallanthus sonchifolius TaxID=185202 RepID=A0ACB9CEX6_9ASTR|nr:hypothetical protein L1987_64058 [Smallanthus sonchifolius]
MLEFTTIKVEAECYALVFEGLVANFLNIMEKENSTEEEPVGFPAPKNVNELDHNVNVPTKNDFSDDGMVGTTVDTEEKPQEKAPYVHEEDEDIEPSTTAAKHFLDHELYEEITSSSKRHLVDAEMEDTSKDMEIRSQEDDKFPDKNSSSSSVGLSSSENSVNTHAGEPDINKEDQEKGNSVNDITLDFTATGIEISGPEDDNSTGEPDNQKEDHEKGNLVNDVTPSCTSTDIEIRTREEDNFTTNSSSSSPAQPSSSENSINALALEPDIQKEDQEKGNLVNDVTTSCTSTDTKIRTREEDNFTTNSSSSSPAQPSSSENSISALALEPDIQKEDQEKGNLVNDVTPSCTSTDIEIRTQEEDNFTTNSASSSPARLSSSENLINALAREPEIQKENNEKGNIVDDTILNYNAEEGEILDCVEDKNDTGKSPETTIVNRQSAENMEMKSKDVSHTSFSKKDGESSSFEERGDIKTDPSDNTSGKKEESLVLYGTHEPKTVAWLGKASVLTKFVKSCAVSNIFRRISRGTDEHNDSNEKDNSIDSSKEDSQEVKHITLEKPRWRLSSLSLIRISHDKNQGNKADLKEVFFESLELKPIKGRIILYTKLWCQNCKEARKFLRKKRLRYSEINIDVYPSRKVELEKITGSLDVPKVFFNQVLIGGLNELKGLDESGQLQEKIDYVTSERPSPKAPLPPLSGEDDVSSRGDVDELAVIVRKMKGSIVVQDRFYKFRRVTNCFLGSEAVDFLSEDQFLEREGAIEFARKLAKELFFRHPLVELSRRLRFLLYAILDAYTSEDGKHIAYRTIHGSEEFARYLRIAEELQRLDLNKTAKEERLAFFINLYNLMAIHAILVWGHPEGALDRRKLFNDFKYVIGGCAYSLSDIQNGILRTNQRPPYALIKPFGISDKRFKVALPYPEPLIHFALVSGNRSAPALRCYSPKHVDMELMEAARGFLQSGAFVLDLDSMTISVTKILKWYSVDFGKNEVEVLKHAANYLDVEKTQALLELFDSTQIKVVYQPYDWRLNS